MTRVMIVDDSEESRSLLKDFLLAHNHDVVAEASDGVEAIKKYYSNQPDLIFLDLVMPNLDGLSVLKKIRSHDHSSKIIVLTGNDDSEIFNECTKLGVLAFLIKPFNLNDILDVISFSNEIILMK